MVNTFQEYCHSISLMIKQNKWILIGISGASNCGKTTITNFLTQKFTDCKVIHQDDYFREENDPVHVWIDIKSPPKRYQNWESQSSINWELLAQKVETIVKHKPTNPEQSFLFIEGHIIFNNDHIAKLFDKKFFIDIEKDIMYKRRINHKYIPPDPLGYFEEWVWPQYLENRKLLITQKDIHYIDGLNTLEFIIQIIKDSLFL